MRVSRDGAEGRRQNMRRSENRGGLLPRPLSTDAHEMAEPEDWASDSFFFILVVCHGRWEKSSL